MAGSGKASPPQIPLSDFDTSMGDLSFIGSDMAELTPTPYTPGSQGTLWSPPYRSVDASFGEDPDYSKRNPNRGIRAPSSYIYRQQLRTPFAKLWSGVVILFSIYSTALSWAWFALAATRFHFPDLGQPYRLSVEDLSTLIAAGAKTIELSFVLVCSTCIGQELSRRLVHVSRRGATISEIQLKFFLAQPGAIISNLQAFLCVVTSWLGAMTVAAAVVAVLYTTASDALVSPKASMKPPSAQTINAIVQSGFINTTHIDSSCPIQVSTKYNSYGYSQCNDLQQNALSYHDLMLYLGDFSIPSSAEDPLHIATRPPPRALDNDLTNIVGLWLDDPTSPYVTTNNERVVNNVTLLLPHVGVVTAAKEYGLSDTPQDENGAGELQISASVLTPSINVLCAEMNDGPTLDTILISNWPEDLKNRSLNKAYMNVTDDWYNGTAFDDFWHFSGDHRPPAFNDTPAARNTRISWSTHTNDTMYILAADPNDHLLMCGMKAQLQQGCSTNYHWTLSNGNLSLDCEPTNDMRFFYLPDPGPGVRPVSEHALELGEFVYAANTWAIAIGIAQLSNVNGSLETELTELWPQSDSWNSTRPTFAETLAVLVGSLLVSGAHGAPLADPVNAQGFPEAFNQTWPISTSFPASVSISDYSTGGTSSSQRGFYLILIAACAINTICLGYLILSIARDGNLLHDFFEPQSLFGLALNSAPDPLLAPARPLVLDARQLKQRWVVQGNEHSVFIEVLDGHSQPRSLRRSGVLGEAWQEIELGIKKLAEKKAPRLWLKERAWTRINQQQNSHGLGISP